MKLPEVGKYIPVMDLEHGPFRAKVIEKPRVTLGSSVFSVVVELPSGKQTQVKGIYT